MNGIKILSTVSKTPDPIVLSRHGGSHVERPNLCIGSKVRRGGTQADSFRDAAIRVASRVKAVDGTGVRTEIVSWNNSVSRGRSELEYIVGEPRKATIVGGSANTTKAAKVAFSGIQGQLNRLSIEEFSFPGSSLTLGGTSTVISGGRHTIPVYKGTKEIGKVTVSGDNLNKIEQMDITVDKTLNWVATTTWKITANSQTVSCTVTSDRTYKNWPNHSDNSPQLTRTEYKGSVSRGHKVLSLEGVQKPRCVAPKKRVELKPAIAPQKRNDDYESALQRTETALVALVKNGTTQWFGGLIEGPRFSIQHASAGGWVKYDEKETVAFKKAFLELRNATEGTNKKIPLDIKDKAEELGIVQRKWNCGNPFGMG